MYKFIIYAALVVAALGILYSQSVLLSYPNASIIKMPVNGSYSQKPTSGMVYSAEAYINGTLGQAYYYKYVNLAGGTYYGNNGYVYFAYSVPFANSSAAPNLLGITVSLNGSNVINYIGPSKPYTVAVSKGSAISTAENYSMFNDSAHVEGGFGTNSSASSNYSIVWAIISNNPTKLHNYYGVYVDALTGNIVGEFVVSPYAYSNYSSQGYGTLGNFSIFYLTTAASQAGTSQVPLYYYAIVALIIIAIAVVVLIRTRPKKKSKYNFLLNGSGGGDRGNFNEE